MEKTFRLVRGNEQGYFKVYFSWADIDNLNYTMRRWNTKASMSRSCWHGKK